VQRRRRRRRLTALLQHVRQLVRQQALAGQRRSEEHTSELQSLTNLVCRLLLEKKKSRPERLQKALYQRASPFTNRASHACRPPQHRPSLPPSAATRSLPASAHQDGGCEYTVTP